MVDDFNVMINGISEIALTKLDVLDDIDKIGLCIGYEVNGKLLKSFPADVTILSQCTPVYEFHEGWKESLAGIRSYKDLPEAAKQYIIAIEKIAGAKVSIISLSPDRADTIIR